MKKSRNHLTVEILQILIGVAFVVAGIVLLVKPGTSLVTMCYALGAASLIKGIISLVKARSQENSTISTVSGIFFIIISIVLLLHPKFVLSLIPVIIGVCILGYGISSLFAKRKKGFAGRLLSVIVVIIGIAVIVTPFKFAEAVTAITGIALIAVGVLIIIAEFTARKYVNTQATHGEGYQEVDFTDVDD